MGELHVRGRADAWLQPGRAVLDVHVTASDPHSQHAAVEDLAELCAVVDDVVNERRNGPQGLVRRVVVSSITSTEDVEHGPGGTRRRTGFSATRTSVLDCRADADGLTGLVGALAHDGVRVHGPRWHVNDDDPAWVGVRTAAVTDARRRAEAYAMAVDGHVGAVRWISEPGLRGGAPDAVPRPHVAAARLASAGGHEAGEARAVRIAVEPVQVTVAVEAAFDLRP
ncbi:MAG TPA: SIMPL domain-containing protein [Euzebyales bacterium]|nr:SIMPL domain-containing protein [Euzebyales bacterium]